MTEAERDQAPPAPDFDVDRLVHEPARLGILTVLSSVRSAEFLFLQSTLGLSKGNLSSHLGKLEQGGLVEITKKFVGKKPQTSAALTPAGLEAIGRYWRQLDHLRGLGGPGA
ncbi:winged helix-turn-helix domain-containing protein [Microlunatus flavus]|uniref:DNA-binding transcriptional regulator, MarR family n=1 Tax=Microlunatus flavus TaxID=1036181 RepID=A0A1H8ZTT7_9ACTN|nr:transcriptional regulator [Microlunatus flavus]SEP67852.1 DNA-binding transcriptional regulator, MarR family [Microlunatus flavus]